MAEKAPQRLYKKIVFSELQRSLQLTSWDVRHSVMATLISPFRNLGPSIMTTINPATMTAEVSGVREDVERLVEFCQNYPGDLQDMRGEDDGDTTQKSELPEQR